MLFSWLRWLRAWWEWRSVMVELSYVVARIWPDMVRRAYICRRRDQLRLCVDYMFTTDVLCEVPDTKEASEALSADLTHIGEVCGVLHREWDVGVREPVPESEHQAASPAASPMASRAASPAPSDPETEVESVAESVVESRQETLHSESDGEFSIVSPH